MLLTAHIPHEPFNTLVREKKAGKVMGKILEALKPEAAYFTEQNGSRCGIFVVDVADPSAVPGLVEPLFLAFEADCELRICMKPEDLAKSGIDSIGDKWG
jgi:hypothetical protein